MSTRDVITLPLRVGFLATRIGLRLTEEAVVVALRTTERLAKAVLSQEARSAPQGSVAADRVEVDVVIAAPPRPAGTRRRPGPRPNGRPATGAVPASMTSEDAIALERPAAHVSAEPQLVEAFAEPGAEEGAGAAVHVAEPWSGYARMPADDVIARLGAATPEEVAVVELYERLHRRRKTVLRAAEHELALRA